jgi:hypothetical protein
VDFDVPDELTALLKAFADFLDREVRPLEEELQPDLWSLAPDHAHYLDVVQEVRRRSATAGF